MLSAKNAFMHPKEGRKLAILHVLLCAPAVPQNADEALRAMRLALHDQSEPITVLLFCDLPDANAAQHPEDDALIRHLQSGVMAISTRMQGRALLLIRSRRWDHAQRRYLGASQPVPAQQIIAQLIAHGAADAAFSAATFTPASLKGRFCAILFSDSSLACTPDIPTRLAKGLTRFACGRIAYLPIDTPPLLLHLVRLGFSLNTVRLSPLPPVFMASAEALAGCTDGFPNSSSWPVRNDCPFVRQSMPSMDEILRNTRRLYLDQPIPSAFLPLAQLAALLVASLLGSPMFAFAALILPDLRLLCRPAAWPGALVRAALLPIHAAIALDALLLRIFAHTAPLRLMLPAAAKKPCASILMGLTLLFLTFSSVHALPVLLPLALLWVFSPLILKALNLPASERIPLTEDERILLRTDAESLLFDKPADTPCLGALCACASCMLGLIEPDEAARQVEALTQTPPSGKPLRALDLSALLVSAQYLREQMSSCDAALRPLPARIESIVRDTIPADEASLLARFLHAALSENADQMREKNATLSAAADALFLPKDWLSISAPCEDTLPLLRPHTYCMRRASPPENTQDDCTKNPSLRALCLASAALDSPFVNLFLRSPVVAPYVPVFAES